MRRCTPFNALSVGSPAVLALHRAISLNSGIQQGILAERRGRSLGQRGDDRGRNSSFASSSKNYAERGSRPPRDDSDRPRRVNSYSSKFGRSDSSRGRSRPERSARPGFGERSERSRFGGASFDRPDRPRFDDEKRSSKPGFASSESGEVDPRFQSGKKPGKWERAALEAGAGRSDWRDVRAVRKPGTGPTKRYSKPSDIWDRFRRRDNENGAREVDSFGDPVEAPSGRRTREPDDFKGRVNRRAEKKFDRRSPQSSISDLEDLEIENAVPELGDEDIAPRRSEAYAREAFSRPDRAGRFESRDEKSYERRTRDDTLPDRIRRPESKEPYIHVHFDRKPERGPYESLGRTREDKKEFNKKLAERGGRPAKKPLGFAKQESSGFEDIAEAMELDQELAERYGKPAYASKSYLEESSEAEVPRQRVSAREHELIREKRSEPIDVNDVPSRLPVTSASSELIFGRNSVMSVLRAKRRKMFKLYVHERLFPDAKGGEELYWELGRLAKDAGVTVIEVTDDWLPLFEKTCLGKPHNVSPFVPHHHYDKSNNHTGLHPRSLASPNTPARLLE